VDFMLGGMATRRGHRAAPGYASLPCPRETRGHQARRIPCREPGFGIQFQ
jgi:hypothetical protein